MKTESCLSGSDLHGCMHVDYSKVPNDIKEYLDKHYARDNDFEWVDGQLADAAVDISKMMHNDEDLNEMHERIMRQCWETGWNNIYDSGVNLYEMINMNGFLSKKEGALHDQEWTESLFIVDVQCLKLSVFR